MRYKRILLKLSGEALGGNGPHESLDFAKIRIVAKSLRDLVAHGHEVGVVIGAGNIFRARMVEGSSLSRVAADHMGMMGTVINALALQAALEEMKIDARVLSAISMPEIVEDYVHKRAIKHFKNKRIVIFAGGTGRPFFTTDTAAIVRALEVKADVVLKASTVDGVYDADPRIVKKAKKYTKVTYAEALDKRLKVMDATAFALAQENDMRVLVFRFTPANVLKAAAGKSIGTLVTI